METTIKKLDRAIFDKIEQQRKNGESVSIDFLQELEPLIILANGLAAVCDRLNKNPERALEPDFRHMEDQENTAESMDLLDDIQQKINECERQYKKWIQLRNDTYKTLSKNALRDSESLIALAKQSIHNLSDKKKLQELVNTHNIYLAKLI